ncbi:MAG: prephenate dehydrogenase [Thermoanaerobaculia bacterium]
MNTVLIVGLGLIGGSAGIALRRRGWDVTYLDPHVDLDDAQRAGAAGARAESLVDADVTLLATPVDVAVSMLPSMRGVVTSACSVMRPLRAIASKGFVAGHPMAGSHERGLAAARADLFEGKPWFVDADDERVDELIRDCGAVRERTTAEEHDAAVALTSHLPQVLSTALAAYLHDRPDVLRFAGSGLRTFLRLAGSDAAVWASVLEANRDQITPHAEAVEQLVRELLDGDPTEAFRKAQALWRRL